MNSKSIAFLLISLAACSAVAQQAADAPLVANAEEDSFAIAEHLYAQGRQSPEPTTRIMVLRRSAELFRDFVKKFPKSAKRDKALYLQAVCLDEAGDAAASDRILVTLAKQSREEYGAVAAYKLATKAAGRQAWETALNHYQTAYSKTKRAELKQDALYRKARAQQQLGKKADAEASFRELLGMKGENVLITQSATLALAQMQTEAGQYADAYGMFVSLQQDAALDPRLRGTVTLQAARLAARLEKPEESQKYYRQLLSMPDMGKYAGEAQMESLVTLFRDKKYKEVLSLLKARHVHMDDAALIARRAVIAGQSAMELKQYRDAADYFQQAEKAQPGTPLAADAGYRRMICVQQIPGENFFVHADAYVNAYDKGGCATAGLPCVDLVRLMYADRLMLVEEAKAAAQYNEIELSQLPEAVRADATYKKAWCFARVPGYEPLSTLSTFIETYPNDSRVAEALALRATVHGKMEKVQEALADYDRVIRDFPQSSAVPVCMQRAAQLCAGKDAPRMVNYYKSFIQYFSERTGRGVAAKPAALAEAHYNIGCALYESAPAEAVQQFQNARAMYPEQYAALVDQRLVQCFFKMKDAENLRLSLEKLEQSNAASYKGLPPAILRWCGWMCFQNQKYFAANKYLTDALEREPREKYTAADGSEQERPKVEPIVWKTLARCRLELELYSRGLEAADHYVNMEKQPYRKAEGMRDRALLLIGLNRCSEARKVCEDAISMGIDGPIKSSLFLALGDACYTDAQYSEAAKFYGRTANVVSDKELKPLSLYKIICALKRCGKDGEANQYEQNLRSEFANWSPPSGVQRMMEQGGKTNSEAPASAQPVTPPAA